MADRPYSSIAPWSGAAVPCRTAENLGRRWSLSVHIGRHPTVQGRPCGYWEGPATAQESPPGSGCPRCGRTGPVVSLGWLAGCAELWTATVVRPVTPRMDGRVRSPGPHCGR
jgi:hypothetical protein